MTIATATTPDLIYALQRQYPSGVTTMGDCANGCGNSARGSGWCSACIGAELVRRGAREGDVTLAKESLGLRAKWIAATEAALEALLEQLEGKHDG